MTSATTTIASTIQIHGSIGRSSSVDAGSLWCGILTLTCQPGGLCYPSVQHRRPVLSITVDARRTG
ncbi:hypothetical protein KTU01_19090 [Kocuria turfanensis]|uniref:Uncharacterized protein n=1 Tax=Kocuria turfanensis TaxID=388357 RepID=A0A512IDK9_9MICC|nr:hypothetical protein KTU01_19090 [Kocuria turfanensis]